MNNTENSIDRHSENPVSGFPLTVGDLVAFAETWWNDFIDNDLFVTLTGQSGRREFYNMQFASDRLDRIAEFLGNDEVERIRGYVEEFWERKVGPRQWNAYKAGDSIIQDEAAERSEKQAMRAGESEPPNVPAPERGDWSNAETGAFHRWFTTDPDVTKNWRDVLAEIRDEFGPISNGDEVRQAFAGELRKQAAAEWRALNGGLLSDLLDLAFIRANWSELADAFLSESMNDANPKTLKL